MKTLELKHIAPYLPYGLKIANRSLKGIIINIWELKHNPDNIYETINNVLNGINQIPILRPLSDLTKEIEHNGERFVPLYKINNYTIEEYYNNGRRDDKSIGLCDRMIESDLTFGGGGSWEGGYEPDIDSYQFYKLYEKLFEWHFDVFGLIEDGLAIDINTINELK